MIEFEIGMCVVLEVEVVRTGINEYISCAIYAGCPGGGRIPPALW